MPGFDYLGCYAYNLTFVTRQRKPLFQMKAWVRAVEDTVRTTLAKHGFTPLAYCFMPDHLHLLTVGGEKSSLQDFVRLFKQLSGYHAKRQFGVSLWQTSYYDHVLRHEEDVRRVASYIWDNPVRAGLCETRLDYEFSGPKPIPED